jgi:glycosyltransferase involved in cell wall biosynthesis
VPLGYVRPTFTEEQLARGLEFWREHGILPNNRTIPVCFFGTLGRMYDFGPVFEAARRLLAELPDVRFFICGDGPLLDELRRISTDLPNVTVPGWVNAERSAALMSTSQLGLAPYRDDPNFRNNVPNKPAEYLAYGLPFLVAIDGLMADLVSKERCGYRYRSAADLAAAIRRYCSDRPTLAEARRNARRAFEESFDGRRIYAALTADLETLAKCG